jgi:hypothetical protein
MDEDGVLTGTRRIWSFASETGSERDERGWGGVGAVMAVILMKLAALRGVS